MLTTFSIVHKCYEFEMNSFINFFFCQKEFVCDKSSSPDTLYVEQAKRCEINEQPINRLRSPSQPLPLLPAESSVVGWKWQPISVCHYSCIVPGVGLKLVEGKTCKTCEPVMSIKICRPQKEASIHFRY